VPARRLPWFKLWPEGMRHEKVVLLSDSAFRTWIVTLAAASEQATRWRFASVLHLVSVTARTEADVRELIGAHLLDISSSGEVWVHDWRQWQERYASDFTPRTHRNGSANVPRSLPGEERGEIKSKRENEERTTPQPPPPDALRAAEGEWQNGANKISPEVPVQNSGRRSGRRKSEPSSAPPPEVAAPLSPADRELWAGALSIVRSSMSAANVDILEAMLVPVGRGVDGGLLLRAPPSCGMSRYRNTLVRSLADAGDEHAAHVAIFEQQGG
jgi:hypothetical protein